MVLKMKSKKIVILALGLFIAFSPIQQAKPQGNLFKMYEFFKRYPVATISSLAAFAIAFYIIPGSTIKDKIMDWCIKNRTSDVNHYMPQPQQTPIAQVKQEEPKPEQPKGFWSRIGGGIKSGASWCWNHTIGAKPVETITQTATSSAIQTVAPIVDNKVGSYIGYIEAWALLLLMKTIAGTISGGLTYEAVKRSIYSTAKLNLKR